MVRRSGIAASTVTRKMTALKPTDLWRSAKGQSTSDLREGSFRHRRRTSRIRDVRAVLLWILVALACACVTAESPPLARFVPVPTVWQTPPIRPEGFQFEIQISSLGTAYSLERVKASIAAHDLGEHASAIAPVFAPEWGYSFTHLNGHLDGAGRRIEAGYPTPPATRAQCVPVLERFLHTQYIRGAPHPWASMNGHYPWQHYAAQFGFDQIGSEIGENINNYQWHFALTRGAARQFARPWFIDFSAWHGPSITDYSEPGIWGEHSGRDHGHSISLFERSLITAYMAGAGQITAEAGGAIAFLPEPGPGGVYPLSPYGEACRRFRAFTRACPDPGISCTPIAIVLDRLHGAYPGFGERLAFHHFPYGPGDTLTWDLIELLWPGGWEVMGREEQGTLVSGPFGDVFDVLLQDAPQHVLNSYPCLLLSGAVQFSEIELARLRAYLAQGGTLLANTVYTSQLKPLLQERDEAKPGTKRVGEGKVEFYGPDWSVNQLPEALRKLLALHLPVRIEGDLQYLVNIRGEEVLITLVNNHGVRKAPREPVKIDGNQVPSATIRLQGRLRAVSARELRTARTLKIRDESVEITVGPGEAAVVEIRVEHGANS